MTKLMKIYLSNYLLAKKTNQIKFINKKTPQIRFFLLTNFLEIFKFVLLLTKLVVFI